MTIRIINIYNILHDKNIKSPTPHMRWSLLESTPPDPKNWRQLSLIQDTLTLDPGNYSIILTLDAVPNFAHIDFLLSTNNSSQKYYRFQPHLNTSFVSEPMYFTVPTNLKLLIYYKVINVPHIDPNPYEDQIIEERRKIPHIESELLSGNVFIITDQLNSTTP